jgi:sulfate/thiosulfate-binding protein
MGWFKPYPGALVVPRPHRRGTAREQHNRQAGLPACRCFDGPLRQASFILYLVLGLCLARTVQADVLKLLNVSYDPTREFFLAYNAKFADHYREVTGQTVVIAQSHGGSGKQARSVIEGLRADVVTLALAYDVQVIADHHFIGADWEARLPGQASPFTSTIVFLVRRGNPLQIHDWPDLIRTNVQVITPNPKTSGGARWNFLAAWGYVTVGRKEGEREAEQFVTQLYHHVPVLDSGARGASTTFVQKAIGDVFITWENEAALALQEYRAAKMEVIYPSVSILAQPCVAVVDRNVDRRGQTVRAAAQAYLKYLYSDEAQELIARSGYRPVNPQILAQHRQRYPEMRLFTVKDVAGNWTAAQTKFFAEDGVFDRIYRP